MVGNWATRWEDRRARRAILVETVYVVGVIAALPLATVLVWLETPNDWFDKTVAEYRTFELYAYSVLGGILGGAIFDLKWLYHSVAHGKWNRDRRLWRLFTPIISGGLAFGVMLLATAGLLPLVDTDALKQPPAAMGLAFLVGYFSDNTIAAMARLASRLFGEHHSRRTPRADDDGSGDSTS